MIRAAHLYTGGCPEYAGDPGRDPACPLCRSLDGLPELPRHRVERLVEAEWCAIVVRIVRKLEPRAPVRAIEQAAEETVRSEAVKLLLTDAEVESASVQTDEEVRRSFREHYEPKLQLRFAGAMPS